MERWSKFDAEAIQLAKIRIYDVLPGAAPRIIVLVPSDDGGDGDIYELDMVNQDVHNQVEVAERAKALFWRRACPHDDNDRQSQTRV